MTPLKIFSPLFGSRILYVSAHYRHDSKALILMDGF